LNLSSGAVSMLLGDLQTWGAVRKASMPGERREYYQAETSIWKMVSRVFRERELNKIRGAIEVFTEAIDGLEKQLLDSRGDVSGLELALSRIRGLHSLALIGEQLLGAVLSGEAVDVSPLQFFRTSGNSDNPSS